MLTAAKFFPNHRGFTNANTFRSKPLFLRQVIWISNLSQIHWSPSGNPSFDNQSRRRTLRPAKQIKHEFTPEFIKQLFFQSPNFFYCFCLQLSTPYNTSCKGVLVWSMSKVPPYNDARQSCWKLGQQIGAAWAKGGVWRPLEANPFIGGVWSISPVCHPPSPSSRGQSHTRAPHLAHPSWRPQWPLSMQMCRSGEGRAWAGQGLTGSGEFNRTFYWHWEGTYMGIGDYIRPFCFIFKVSPNLWYFQSSLSHSWLLLPMLWNAVIIT